jgi:hypothetical protein
MICAQNVLNEETCPQTLWHIIDVQRKEQSGKGYVQEYPEKSKKWTNDTCLWEKVL